MHDATEPMPAVPDTILKRSGHHWREALVAKVMGLDPAAMSTLIARHLGELTDLATLPRAGHRLSDDGSFYVPEHALTTAQAVLLLMVGNGDLSRAVRAAALKGMDRLTVDEVEATFASLLSSPDVAGPGGAA